MGDMETDIDMAARRTAINLMRLNEALELADAEEYSSQSNGHGMHGKREARPYQLRNYYRNWFR
ncbi:MAG: hypothetical protein U5Q03_14875 [Bacteroidota bacterium]|nr:hypothetical protein [Bacteroidota bacterium]